MLVGLWNGKGPVCRDELVVLLALAGGRAFRVRFCLNTALLHLSL